MKTGEVSGIQFRGELEKGKCLLAREVQGDERLLAREVAAVRLIIDIA